MHHLPLKETFKPLLAGSPIECATTFNMVMLTKVMHHLSHFSWSQREPQEIVEQKDPNEFPFK